MGMRPAQDKYFVQLDVGPGSTEVAPPRHAKPDRPGYSDEPSPRRRRRRRKRTNFRAIFVILLGVGLAAWFAWASQQPGGVSGVVNGWVDHTRGAVQDMSTGPDLKNAVKYFNEQYKQTGVYPNPTEEQLASAGIGIDVDTVNCGSQAVVLRTLTVSRLLIAGRDLGEVSGRYGCPANFDDPAPWKSK